MEKTRVLVAGGGPVGAFAAFRLAAAGVDTILVETLPACPDDMRASTFHPPTLDMLAELGVLDDLAGQGLRAPAYHYRNRRSGETIAFDLGELADVSAHPYRLQCEQFKLARLLTSRLDALPHGAARFAHSVTGFAQDADGVTVEVATPSGPATIRADYLIAADGASSTIRKATGTSFDGFTYPERFLTLSTAYPIERHFPGLAGVNYIADAHEWCVLLRVPAFWRVLVPTDAATSDADLLSDAKKDAVFDGLTGDGAAVVTAHRTVYRVHQRVAGSFHHGRVLLVGDAAHLNNPLGGFGMNSGIHDAWNLTTKLLAAGDGPADAALARYDRQRREIATSFVQAQTIANKDMIAGGNGEREAAMAAIARDPRLRRDYLMRQSMYDSLAQESAIQ